MKVDALIKSPTDNRYTFFFLLYMYVKYIIFFLNQSEVLSTFFE